jgi:alpha-galactosidase
LAVPGPKITIVGGGSRQWAPTLIDDIANTESLRQAHIVLEDINPASLDIIADYVRHVASIAGLELTVSTTTNQREALDGADFVVVTITTGGFESMRADRDIPIRYGIRQTVVDGGPAGVSRALRNIPVMVQIARDMVEMCPHAWLLNLTNPMAQICRAITRETSIRTVGLCHEVTVCRFFLSMLLDIDFREIRPVVTGVNHMPVIVSLEVNGEDILAKTLDILEDPKQLSKHIPFDLPSDIGRGVAVVNPTKGDLVATMQVKLELLRLFGALIASRDRHIVEYFPWFLTAESDFAEKWGVAATTIEERETAEASYDTRLHESLRSTSLSNMPSGEMVAPFIDAIVTGRRRLLPLNIPNHGHCPDMPTDAVVEAMCSVEDDTVRGKHVAKAPPFLADHLRRVVTTHEFTVEAALSGSRKAALEAMLADPLGGRMDYHAIVSMTDELIASTKRWLPQFA